MRDIMIIKSIVFDPQQAGMEVEFFGNGGKETLKQCICCDQYHPIQLQVCPKTHKIIEAEAQRQAKEEDADREKTLRRASATIVRTEYNKKHLSGWKNDWQFYMVVIGLPVAAVSVFFIPKENNGWHVFSIATLLIVWVLFWMIQFLGRQHRVEIRANEIYQRVLNGEEMEATKLKFNAASLQTSP